MISSEILQELGSKNLSINADLTKLRFHEDFSKATKEQKKEILTLSNRKRATLYKVNSTGIISARIVAAISAVLKTSPYWYTGESETRDGYTDEIMVRFLREKGFKVKQNGETKVKRKYNRAKTGDKNIVQKPVENDMPEALKLEDAVKLLEALYIRSSVSKKANEDLKNITYILLS